MIQRENAKIVLSMSLIELSKHKNISKITIDEIVKNCGYSRSAFYYNFTDKYDLIDWTFFYKSDEILATYRELEPWGKVLGRILIYFKEYHYFLSKAFSLHGELTFFNSYREYIEKDYTSHIRKKLKLDENQTLDPVVKYSILYNSYGAMGTAMTWCMTGMKEDPMEIGNLLANSIPDAIKQFFIFKNDRF